METMNFDVVLFGHIHLESEDSAGTFTTKNETSTLTASNHPSKNLFPIIHYHRPSDHPSSGQASDHSQAFKVQTDSFRIEVQ
uniref:Uncharacterized protein n=1 Tax=Rhizophagus irregularis (strain DAOM 181602 / DAOM 197198 / MUCL 43194) TaxID=747089 RepID=U9TSL8_RHIID